ncbi:MAG: DUF302 domain-containing protein [Actinomycetota bacterium]|jgi:uncharacterized protein (DUF302 family)|nr:DUF302 domain-containing protein [Actinomycetota bacterium]
MQAIEKTLDQPLDEAERAVRAALAEEGFGILTEIDVAATLEAKLGVQRPPLKILGACNPELAHRALSADPGLALLLPCNVVLEEAGEGRTRVAIVDPRTLLAESGSDARGELEALGAQAASSIERAVGRLSG